MKTYERLATKLSVFEIRFMNDVRANAFIPISAQKRQINIILSGNADTQTDVTGISFALFADNIHVHHLKWDNMGIKTALSVGAKDKISLDNLTFSNNTYKPNLPAQARLIISSFAPEGQFTNVDIQNLIYTNNTSTALFLIENDSLGKIGKLSFDHLSLASNHTTQLGIDVSAAQKTILNNINISGENSTTPTFVQRTPLGEVNMTASVADKYINEYKYIPLSQYKDITPKPVVVMK